MADIAMCPDIACPSRFKCKRNEASGTRASQWQSYMGFKHDQRGHCDDLWPKEPSHVR